MKSLARMTCCWLEVNENIVRTVKVCKRCLCKQLSKPSKWVPWKVSCKSWQYVPMDYSVLFLRKYCPLVVVDAFSGWLEVRWATCPTSDFTQFCVRYSVEKLYLVRSLLMMAPLFLPNHSVTSWKVFVAVICSLCPAILNLMGNGEFVRTFKCYCFC